MEPLTDSNTYAVSNAASGSNTNAKSHTVANSISNVCSYTDAKSDSVRTHSQNNRGEDHNFQWREDSP